MGEKDVIQVPILLIFELNSMDFIARLLLNCLNVCSWFLYLSDHVPLLVCVPHFVWYDLTISENF